ncbi:conserved hypothetical protein [Desulforapulum autotrophicum HRM2]|uniref:Uncharacterized protein n=1 Tax=Desulforapulum autotrophicum (strain ATCC 43914 / DSM 3382 / VKM B-1955 / HRM2) TaxID=177437 RepID=C0QKE3_DESAH|nr:hypothetical protein [Desulforapulum autotrophicum]ACN14014.1 conserved hypothetical protein [Desulforapulum autotrophicum HRM2]
MARENDVVLIYLEDDPVSFARVESIEPDVKKDWYHITLLMLQIPLQTVTWTLKDLYINGEDFFMGGKRMKIEVVESPGEVAVEEAHDTDVEASKEDPSGEIPKESRGKVISLADVRARNKKSSKS